MRLESPRMFFASHRLPFVVVIYYVVVNNAKGDMGKMKKEVMGWLGFG